MDYSDAPLSKIISMVLRETNTDTAKELLKQFPTLHELANALPEEMQKIKGIGAAKAHTLKACLEIGKRLNKPAVELPVIKSPEDVFNLLAHEMRFLDREQFRAIHLNTKNRVLHVEIVSIGTLNSSVVHPRELFKNAIRRSAASIILVHNHPSGDPTPSLEDKEITDRVAQAGCILGISVLDHVVIGDGVFISFKEKGLL